MRAALAGVIVMGLAIGWLIPMGGNAPAASTPAPAADADGKPPPDAMPARAAAVSTPASPRETLLSRADNGHFYTTATVNGQPVDFVIDTGASIVALTMDDARRLGIDFDPGRFEVVGSGASGPVRGEAIMLDVVDLDGKEVRQVRGAVLEGLEMSLLGQSYLSRITSVTMAGAEMRLR